MLEVGEQVGAYNIVRRLGAGGMGEVYLARHRHIGRDAAIKVLLPELSKNEDVVARFFTEARATAAIRHPGIVEIVDCDVHRNGRAYIVMEFLEGENLAEYLARVGSFAADVPRAAAIIIQVAGALGAAHAKGIVHRDMKPDNVFLCAPPVPGGPPLVKVLDFGIAKLVADDGEGRNKTRTGSLLGTPTYMSPEQCRGAGSIDHRTDVYALGCMAFEMIAGRPPFVRAGAGEVLVAHLVEPPPRLSSLVPGVMPGLEAVVGQMLEKEASARPQSMADIVARIDGLFAGELVPVPAAQSPSEGRSGLIRPGAVGQAAAPAMPQPAVSSGPSGPSPGSGPVIAGGTRMMPVSRTTLSDSASEAAVDAVGPRPRRRRWAIPAAAAGVAVLAAVGIGVALQGPAAPPRPRVSPVHEAEAPPPPPPRPAVRPPPEVTIEVSSDPAGAEIFLPGEETARGRTPLKIAVRRGDPPARVTLRAPGYEEATVTLDPGQGDSGPISVALRKTKRGDRADRPDRADKTDKTDKPHGESRHHGGRWTGPRDENDIYKPMGD